jgi:hypothetical protein
MIVADEALRIDVVLELSPVAAAWLGTAKLDRPLDELSERGIDVHRDQRRDARGL